MSLRAFAAFAIVLVCAGPLRAQDRPKALDSDAAWDLAFRIVENDDEDDADEALEELRGRGEDGIWEMLEAAKEWDEEGQELIARALAELGEDAAPELIRTIGEKDDDVRETAIFALGEMGVDALDGLVKFFKETKDPQQQLRAAALLCKLEDDAVAPLVAIVKHGPNDCRPLALSILIDIGGPAIEPLVGILGSTKEVRELSRTGLAKIAEASVAAATSVGLATAPLLGTKLAEVRAVAVELAGRFGGAAVMPKVVDALCSSDEGVRRSAAECAARVGEPAVADLIHCLNASDRKVADAAAMGLAGIGEPAVPSLTRMLKAPIAQIRAEAASALGQMKRRASVADLEFLLDDAEPAVRASAK